MSGYMMIGMTDPGQIRLKNEDHIATQPDTGLAVLADGMGGHQAGEVASHLAVEVILRHLNDAYATDRGQSVESRLGHAVRRANAAIYEAAHSRPDYAGMGSTVVAVLVRNGNIVVAHVGDSRLYRLRASRLEQITEDHSVVQELVNRGLFTREEAQQSVGKNLVTRALGVDPEVAVDVTTLPCENGDTFLLCSDGLNDVVSDEEIGTTIVAAGSNLYTAAFRLVALANQRGGPDNISVILIRREEQAAAQDSSEEEIELDEEEPEEGTGDDGFRVSRDDDFLVDDNKDQR
jgi:protein phosphatase